MPDKTLYQKIKGHPGFLPFWKTSGKADTKPGDNSGNNGAEQGGEQGKG